MPDDENFEEYEEGSESSTHVGPPPAGLRTQQAAPPAAPQRPRSVLRPDPPPAPRPAARPVGEESLRRPNPLAGEAVRPAAVSRPVAGEAARPAAPRQAAPPAPRQAAAPVAGMRKATFFPHPPRDLREANISSTYLEELLMKHLFQAGELRGSDCSSRTRLPQPIVEDALERLRRNKLIDIKGSGGAGLGRAAMIFVLTEAGASMCRIAMERDRYVGPAPIRFDRYLESVAGQSIRGNALTKADIEPHFHDLVVKDEVYDAIGPAMNSGKALFFYGPPGNGKTAVCQRMTAGFGGDIFIPYALLVDDFVVKVFDDTVHIPVPAQEGESWDERWIRIKRPMIIVGGELVLEALDLSYSPEVRYYEAPFQLKANCGMLLIDDFGRQKVSPKDLLNRWIVPLESEFDFLTLHTGKKLKVPFDVFVVFSTNLDPSSLVDGAFLRRVRYKLEVSRPDEQQFRQIFKSECKRKGVRYDEAMLDYLVARHYVQEKRPFNACEPRDLLGQVIDLCAYYGIEPQLTADILDRVVHTYFVRFDKPSGWATAATGT